MTSRISRVVELAGLRYVGWSLVWTAVVFGQTVELPPPADPEAVVEPLLRGPVHEAFAEPYAADPRPGLVIPREPPQPVEELPPEIKPAGETVVWIPGYWAWDDTRRDFIWISGIWRKVPPGQQWSAGHWAAVEGGWQWVPGTWITAGPNPLEYLPEPPATLEQGPSDEDLASADYFWVPGVWRYQVDHYVWRPGYWSHVSPGWVWIPARYVWTPRGCVYLGGYWDFPLETRGHLYAPVCFRQPVYTAPTYCFTPTVAISLTGLTDHFWVRPGYGHYYFGDYYGGSYASLGIYPWFQFTISQRNRYDPLYTYCRHHYHATWSSQRQHWSRNHDWYDHHENWRPPHDWHQRNERQRELHHLAETGNRNPDRVRMEESLNLGRTVADLRDHGGRPGEARIDRISPQERERFRRELTEQVVRSPGEQEATVRSDRNPYPRRSRTIQIEPPSQSPPRGGTVADHGTSRSGPTAEHGKSPAMGADLSGENAPPSTRSRPPRDSRPPASTVTRSRPSADHPSNPPGMNRSNRERPPVGSGGPPTSSGTPGAGSASAGSGSFRSLERRPARSGGEVQRTPRSEPPANLENRRSVSRPPLASDHGERSRSHSSGERGSRGSSSRGPK